MQSCCRGYLTAIKNDGEYGCRFPFTTDACYIGRDSNCDIRIIEPDIKDLHCVIRNAFNKVTVYNVCPDNPVLVNNVVVSAQGHTLNHYDKITICNVTFQWEDAAEKHQRKYSLPASTDEIIDTEFAQRNRCSDPNLRLLISEETDKADTVTVPSQTCDASDSITEPIKQVEIMTTPTTSPHKTDTHSPEMRKSPSSCPRNLASNNDEIPTRLSSSCSKEIKFSRRSRLFGKTYKAAKSLFDSPEERKTSNARTYFAKIITPLQENRTPSKEVKSRFELKQSSFRKSVSRLSFNVLNNAMGDVKESSSTTLCGDGMQLICASNIDNSTKDSNQKEDTLKGNMTLLNNTFETTIANEVTENQSALLTPKCFTKTHHSTPKYVAEEKTETASKRSIKMPENVTLTHHDNTSIHPDRNNDNTIPDGSLSELQVSSISRVASNFIEDTSKNDHELHQTSCKLKSKKKENDLSRTADTPVEVRRNTRNRSNILKKTLEECNEDNLASNEQSQTTPEKCAGDTVSSKNINSEEADFDSYSPEKNLDRKYGLESEKTPFESSNHDLSSEKDHVSAAENVEKSHRSEDSFSRVDVARCTRNLSYISPPENNKSQEFMDSVVSTPKKMSFRDNEVTASQVSGLQTPTRETISVESSVCTPKSPTSSFRNRRSTGFVPFVGTPSEVYRTKKGVLTPAISRFNRPSIEVEKACARDSFSAVLKSKQLSRQQSSERKSTPLKTDKSSIRDSLQLHSPIIEDYSLEFEEETQNESNNDSQFKFVSNRKRRMCKSSFAVENRIMEESESLHSEMTDNNGEVEDSLMPLPSCMIEESAVECDRIVINQTSYDDNSNTIVDGDEDVLNSTYSIDLGNENGSQLQGDSEKISPVKCMPVPKSILTPLPRPLLDREKSAKKVTFVGLREGDSTDNTQSSVYSPSDTIHDLESIESLTNENEFQSHTEEESGLNPLEDNALYVSDKSSTQSDSLLSNPLEKLNDSKRNNEIKKTPEKSPCLLGIRSLFTNSSNSPNCNYSDVSGVEKLMETPGTETETMEDMSKLSYSSPCGNPNPEDVFVSFEEQCFSQQFSSEPTDFHESAKEVPEVLAQKLSIDSVTDSTTDETDRLSNAQSILENGDVNENIALDVVDEPVSSELMIAEEKPVLSPSDLDELNAIEENDDLFRTRSSLVRRCSKHFRIHKLSLCQTIVNTPETIELSSHDCSASLESSLVGPIKSEIANPSRSPKSNFQDVLVELKSKLNDLCKKSAQANCVAVKEFEKYAELSTCVPAEECVQCIKSGNVTGATEDNSAKIDTTAKPNVPCDVKSVPEIVITPASSNTTIVSTNQVEEVEDSPAAAKDTPVECSVTSNDKISNSSYTVVVPEIPVVYESQEEASECIWSAAGESEMKNDVCCNKEEQDLSECSSSAMKLNITYDNLREEEKGSESISNLVLDTETKEGNCQENVSTLVTGPVLITESINGIQTSSPANHAECMEISNCEEPENTTGVIQNAENAEIPSSEAYGAVPSNDINSKTHGKGFDLDEELSQNSQLKKTNEGPRSTELVDSEKTSVLSSDTEKEKEIVIHDSLLPQTTPKHSKTLSSPEHFENSSSKHSENPADNWSSPSEEESSKLTTAEPSPLACSTKIGTSDLGVVHFHSPIATLSPTSEPQEKIELVSVSLAPVAEPEAPLIRSRTLQLHSKESTMANEKGNMLATSTSSDLSHAKEEVVRERRTRSVLRNIQQPALPKPKNKKKNEVPIAVDVQVNIPRIGLAANTEDVAVNKNEIIKLNNTLDNKPKTRRATKMKRTATVAESTEKVSATRKLKSVSIKPAEKLRIRSSTSSKDNRTATVTEPSTEAVSTARKLRSTSSKPAEKPRVQSPTLRRSNRTATVTEPTKKISDARKLRSTTVKPAEKPQLRSLSLAKSNRTEIIAESTTEVSGSKKLRSASVKPTKKLKICSSAFPERDISLEKLENRCSIVLPVLPSITEHLKAARKTKAAPKIKVVENEHEVEPFKPKRINRRLKVTFDTEHIPQLLNDSSDKENTIELTNRGRKPRARKNESKFNVIVETKTRRNRNVETSEDHILVDRNLKQTAAKPKSTSAKNKIETSVEKVENGRRKTRNAKNTADDIVKDVKPKKEFNVGTKVVIEEQLKEVEPEPKKSNKRGAKNRCEEKESVVDKTAPSKRPKSVVEKKSLSVNIAQADVRKATKRAAAKSEENTKKRRKMSKNSHVSSSASAESNHPSTSSVTRKKAKEVKISVTRVTRSQSRQTSSARSNKVEK